MTETTLTRAKPLLGTLVEIRASHACSSTLSEACDEAFARIAHIHALMSVHQPDSDLRRLNASPLGTPVTLAAETAHVLAFALRLAAESDGLFDPTIGGLLSTQGLLPKPAVMPDPAASWCDVELVGEGMVGRGARCHRALLLDLGGIAKGYAVDTAFQLLQAAGCSRIVVNAGGDLRVRFPAPEPIHVRLADGALLPALALTEGAVATSCFNRSGLPDPTAISHLVRPGNGVVQTGAISVVVTAPDCMVADALTKLVALDPVQASPLLTKFAAEARWIEQNAAGIQVRPWPDRQSSEIDVEVA